MWNKHKYAILSFLLIVVIFLTGVRLPYFAEAAGAQTNRTDWVKDKSTTVFEFWQNGSKIATGTKIDLYKDLTANLRFKIDIGESNNENITVNDYVEFNLGKAFSFSGSEAENEIIKDINDKNTGKKICKAIFKKDASGEVKVRFDFSYADPTVFSLRTGEITASINLKVDISKVDPNVSSTHKVQILDQSYDIEKINDKLEINKKGEVNLQELAVEWEVDITRKMVGAEDKHLSLADFTFTDDLTNSGDYVTNSLKINNNPVAPETGSGDRKIVYKIKNSDLNLADKGKATVKFKTKITYDDLRYGKKYTNQALIANDKSSGKSNEAHVEVKIFGKKEGKFDKVNRKLIWEIEFNNEGKKLGNVTIKDELKKDRMREIIPQTRIESFYEVWDGTSWTSKTAIEPDTGSRYLINDVTRKTKLTIETTPNIPANDKSFYEYYNEANVYWGPSNNSAFFSTAVTIGTRNIEKNARDFSIDANNGEIQDEEDTRGDDYNSSPRRIGFETEWTAVFERQDGDSGDYYMYDALIFDNDVKASKKQIKALDFKITELNSTAAVTLPGSTALETVAPPHNRHQILVNADQPNAVQVTQGTSTVKVYAIRKTVGDQIVGHLIQMSNFGSGKSIIKFKSRLMEPEQLLSKTGNGFNYLTLVKGGKMIDTISKFPKYNPKIIKKQAMSNEAAKTFLTGFTADQANKDVLKVGKAAKDNKETAYDKDSKSIIYRISVNAAGINDENDDLGGITVTDELPEGWKFADIKSNENFLIYKGKAASGKGKADATVLAEGSALSTGELTTNNITQTITNPASGKSKAEFKFSKINSPYVIFLKAQLKSDLAFQEKYVNAKQDIINKAVLTTGKKTIKDNGNETKDVSAESEQKVTVDDRFLWKSFDKNNVSSQEKEGYIKWTIVYKPDKTYPSTIKISLLDELSDKLILRREKNSNNLIFEGENYRIFKGSVDKEGNFTETEEIKTGLDDIFKYNKNSSSKKFTINLPDNNAHYKITYITDLDKDISNGEGITNKVSILENAVEKVMKEEKVTKSVSVDASGVLKGFEKLKLIKKSSSGNTVLKDAEFSLNGVNLTYSKTEKTKADGTLEFGRLAPGHYKLKEVTPPSGYKANDTEYDIEVIELELGFWVKLNTNYANVTKEGNELTITNEPIPSNPGGGGGVTPPPTTPETPVTPVVPPKPENPVKPVEPPKPNDPEKPNDPGKPNKPTKPTTPEEPEDPDPEEPDEPEEPDTPDPTPNIPSYPFNNTPDPNDPNSPDEITVIGDDGTPLGRFIKKQKPDGTFEYVDADDGTPLGNIKAHRLPKTGGTGNTWYYAIGAGLILGAGLTFKKRKEEGQED